MNPERVRRDRLHTFTDLPNVGPAVARDLRLLGFEAPAELAGQDPYGMYERLCEVTGVRQDPCVLDVYISITRFMDGEAPKPWWAYTAERKAARA